ncbi:hypothetical protein AGMMS49944_03240 [Spirochaetia bacterium]|nr:hypothetical protein AGMMS49944_03240 [Spirochaetia bacterium]
MNRTMSIDNKNRIALVCGALALIFAILSFAGCDLNEEISGSGGGGLNPVESAAFSSVVGNNTLTITLTGGAYAATPILSQFTITTLGTPGFTSLTGGTVTRLSNTVVAITGSQPSLRPGSGQKITVAAAALASQASSVEVFASGVGGGGLNPVESGAFISVVGDHTLTITLTGGDYAAAPILSQFTITTPGTPGFTSLTGGTVTRLSDTTVDITGLTAVTAPGSNQKITVAAAALASQASSAAVFASGGGEGGLNSVEAAAFTSVVGNDTLTITLTGGTFVPQASLALSQFAITTPGTGGFANLTGGTVTRTSNTEVTITGLTPVTALGNGQKITVTAAALATQATAVTVAASGPVESEAFTSVVGNDTLTITLTGGDYAAAPILSQFTITTPGTPGFTSLTGGMVTRTSNTEVRITGLAAVTAPGSNQKITVAAAALATQASSAAVFASGGGRVVSTLAGSGTAGFADGTGTAARFRSPSGITTDGSGNLYVADDGNHRIRQIVIASGAVTTLAGSIYGYADGMGTAARFRNPEGITTDGSGNLYVTDRFNHRIRKIDATGLVTTLAGGSDYGYADGMGTAAQFNEPCGITRDGSGNLYVTDRFNHRIRKIDATGVVTTLAGSGTAGYANGTGTAAQFRSPSGITTDGSGNLYVADYGNHRIRKIVIASGVVTTLAGSGTFDYADGTGTAARFSRPYGITTDGSGNLYVADSDNNRIRKIVIASGAVTTLVGSGTAGWSDGTDTAAQFNQPMGITIDGSGNLYVVDYGNHRIRKIAP